MGYFFPFIYTSSHHGSSSTFFGGDNSSWATPQTTHTYFRNIQLWGSSAASDLAGATVNSASLISLSTASKCLLTLAAGLGAVVLGGML